MGYAAARIAAGLAALGLVVAACFGAILGIFVAADAADPAQPASDGEALALGAGFALVEGLLAVGALTLLVYALSGRFLPARWLAIVPVACAVLVAALVALSSS